MQGRREKGWPLVVGAEDFTRSSSSLTKARCWERCWPAIQEEFDVLLPAGRAGRFGWFLRAQYCSLRGSESAWQRADVAMSCSERCWM
jgi:hypothetical protein